MDHFYKYESMSEADRNGLIPYMHVPEALRIDPEDRVERDLGSGRSDDSQEHKPRPGGTVGAGKGYQRKTRDVYILLADFGEGWQEQDTQKGTWEEMRQLLDLCRMMAEPMKPETRYSYRKRRIKIQ